VVIVGMSATALFIVYAVKKYGRKATLITPSLSVSLAPPPPPLSLSFSLFQRR